MVRAVSAGECEIVVIASDGGDRDICEVTVMESGSTVKVTGVSLDKASASMKVGESLRLKASVLPENATNKSVTWKSSDEQVASVDNTGLVTAIADGAATIFVTTNDGKKTASCQISIQGEGVDIHTHFEPIDIYPDKLILTSPAPNGVQTVDICYGTSPNPKITDNVAVATMGEDGQLLLNLTGLQKGTVYYIRAYRRNGANVEYFDDEVSVETIGGKSFKANVAYHDYGVGDGLGLVALFFSCDYSIQPAGTYLVQVGGGALLKKSTDYAEMIYLENGTGKLMVKMQASKILSDLYMTGEFDIKFMNLETNVCYHVVAPSEWRLDLR